MKGIDFENFSKTDNNENDVQSESSEEIKSNMIHIIDDLFEILKYSELTLDDISNFKDKLKKYLKYNDRLLFSEISNCFFNCENQTTVLDNLEIISEEAFSRLDDHNADKVDIMIIKIYDHINLAFRQITLFNLSKEEINLKVDNYLAENLQNLKDGMEKNNREVSTSLISLVGIFTALSFVVFGGITSFQSIFSNVKDVPLTKVMILGCIWSIAIVNIVLFLLYFMAKLTGKNIKTNQYSSSMIRRYPFICILNSLILTLFIISLWLRFIEISSGNEWIIALTKNNKDFLTFGSIILLLVIIVIWTTILRRLDK